MLNEIRIGFYPIFILQKDKKNIQKQFFQPHVQKTARQKTIRCNVMSTNP